MKIHSIHPFFALFISTCTISLFVNGCFKIEKQSQDEEKQTDNVVNEPESVLDADLNHNHQADKNETAVNDPKPELDADINHNHMADKYETAVNQGKSCMKHVDCDTEPGRNDGFCDSLIGYQCSTKCSANEQCVQTGEEYAPGKSFHYYCRDDGRCVPKEFVTVWTFPFYFQEKDLELKLPAQIDGTVDWGDGERSNCSAGDVPNCSHIYKYNPKDTSREYTVAITGKILNWSISDEELDISNFDNSIPKNLLDIKSFGPVELGVRAFAGTENLSEISATDIPNPNTLKTLEDAFWESHWNAPNMSLWDTSNVISMNGMFRDAHDFDQPIANWDTSKVTDMSAMFLGASSFNQPLDGWNTSNVTNMNSMFRFASEFHQDLSHWSFKKVKVKYGKRNNARGYHGMFYKAEAMLNVSDSNDMFCQIYKSIKKEHKDISVYELVAFSGGFSIGGVATDLIKKCNLEKK